MIRSVNHPLISQTVYAIVVFVLLLLTMALTDMRSNVQSLLYDLIAFTCIFNNEVSVPTGWCKHCFILYIKKLLFEKVIFNILYLTKDKRYEEGSLSEIVERVLIAWVNTQM